MLGFRGKENYLEWKFLRKKWRWKWRWKWKRNLKSSFSYTRYPYLRLLQICNCFFIRYIIPSTFSTGLGVFDAILAAFSIENALKVVINTLISAKIISPYRKSITDLKSSKIGVSCVWKWTFQVSFSFSSSFSSSFFP